VAGSYRLVVFDALLLRAYISNDNNRFPDEMAAFRLAFQRRRFRILLTDGILSEYEAESNKFPPFAVQPTLNGLSRQGRAGHVEENQLNRPNIRLPRLRREHREFIVDAIAASASHLITNRQEWLRLSAQTNSYGLQVVMPRRFVEMEG
jgi:hypothetical protein